MEEEQFVLSETHKGEYSIIIHGTKTGLSYMEKYKNEATLMARLKYLQPIVFNSRPSRKHNCAIFIQIIFYWVMQNCWIIWIWMESRVLFIRFWTINCQSGNFVFLYATYNGYAFHFSQIPWRQVQKQKFGKLYVTSLEFCSRNAYAWRFFLPSTLFVHLKNCSLRCLMKPKQLPIGSANIIFMVYVKLNHIYQCISLLSVL